MEIFDEVLPTFNARNKWWSKVKELKINDVVVVINDQTPRATWPLGRVTDIYPGKDNTSRVARVKIGNKEFTRPVVKLIPLEEK
jgi:hypothetical protein